MLYNHLFTKKKILLDFLFKFNITDPCGVWQVVPMPSSGWRLRKLASCSSRQLSPKSTLIHTSKVIVGVQQLQKSDRCCTDASKKRPGTLS
jgi:hypothetical protein